MASIDSTGATTPEHDATPRPNSFYFAAWRWHFYAGIFVAPFLIMLAVTGLIILWFSTIAPENGARLHITPAGTPLGLSQQSDAVLASYPAGHIGQYMAPYSPENPAIFRVDLKDGARMLALDPYSGKVVQDSAQDGTWNEFATKIHGTLLIGDPGDRLIEIAAGFAIVLIVTGLYLWWPRGGRGWGEMLVPDLAARGRAWWKSLHQVTGFWLSLFLLFFLISGMAWTGVCGGKFVQAWSTFPAEKFDNVPLSAVDHASMNHGAEKTVPWALEETPMPASGSAAGVDGLPMGVPVVLESIVGLGRALGFEGRFQVMAPKDADGVWTLSQDSMSYDSTRPTADRTVHVDQYSGKILADIGFADYSLGGKAMAAGVALHEGQLGGWNLVVNAVYCLAVLFVAASGVVMWWKRRPSGGLRLAAPPMPADLPMWKGAVLLALFLSLAFPLVGLTLLAVLAVDTLIVARLPALKRLLT